MGYLPRSPRTQTWSPASSFASCQLAQRLEPPELRGGVLFL